MPTRKNTRAKASKVKSAGISLRLAKVSDLDSMVEIINQTFSKEDAKTARDEIGEIISNPDYRQLFVVASDGKRIVGLAGLIQSWLDFTVYEILWVAVRPEYQGSGIGLKIIKEIVTRAKTFKGHSAAHTILLSTEATAFFGKCGFTSIAELGKNAGCLMVMDVKKRNCVQCLVDSTKIQPRKKGPFPCKNSKTSPL